MLVSVIVPCFGYGRFLTDAVHSLVGGLTVLGEMPGQTLGNFEAIIIDDASHDETPEVCEKLNEHDRVRCLRLNENVGTAGALNAGVEVASGELIAVLSADDMFEPWHLEQFVTTLKANPGTVIYNDIRAFIDNERLRIYRLPEYDFNNLLHKAGFGAGVLYEKPSWKKCGGYPVEMRYGREDWAFGIALGQVGVCGIKASGPPGYLYRRGDHNRTRRNKTVEWHKRFRQQLRDLFPHLYRGERPVACCGGGRNTNKKRNNPGHNPAPLPGRGGMVVLAYAGRNTGTETFFTPEGGRYQFGGNSKNRTGYVDKKDVAFLLGLAEKGKRLFKRYKPRPALNLTRKEIEQVNPGTTRKAARKARRRRAAAAGAAILPHRTPPLIDNASIEIIIDDPDDSFVEVDQFDDGTQVLVPSDKVNGILDKDELLTLAAAVLTEADLNATSGARKLAREHGINLADIEGTGRKGRITVKDVKNALKEPVLD